MNRQNLGGTWFLNAVNTGSTPPEAAELPADIPMAVPGDIASALIAQGLVEDPYYGRNELNLLWLGRTDWSLKTSFTLEAADITEASFFQLDFDGIDTVAEVLLNGVPVAGSFNMFRRLRPDITSAVREGENTLEVIIRSPEDYCDAAAKDLPYPIPHTITLPWQWTNRNLLRKVGCHGGWDWGITLMTGGVYEVPILVSGSAGRVEYLTTRQEKIGSGPDWMLHIVLDYRSRDAGELPVSISFDGTECGKTFEVVPGVNRLEYAIEVKSPDLWWPAGQGGQPLYDLCVTAAGESLEKRIGFRSVEVVVEDDRVGRSMTFRVNGRDIFAKGANWIPVDALPSRQADEVYRRLLTDARDAHMNMVRLWGGGQYEKEVFYSLCDELGLMIWHDMMFACSLYPANPEFLDEVDGEIRHQVMRLKDHPSIVLWCGNNEDVGAMGWFPESRENPGRYLVDYDRLNEGIVGRAVRELDPDRAWWPSSPSAGPGDYSDCWHDDTKGDMHYWSVWHENLPFESYYDVVPRFCSEFGFQSFNSERTVNAFTPEGQRNITSPVMRHHQKNNAGNSIILSTMARYFRMPASFADQLYLSQVQQARAIRTAVDYWRANRPVSMGALYWQLNDNWPVASWSGIEYDGTWKLLHYEARRFFAPLRICLYRKDGALKVTGVNDAPEERRGVLEISLVSFDGDVLDTRILDDLCIPAGSAESCLSIPLEELADPRARTWENSLTPHAGEPADVVDEGFTDRFIAAEWIPAGTARGEGSIETLFLTKPRDCELADASVTVSPGTVPGSIVLETDKPAFHVMAEHPAGGQFDDAGFSLLPGRPVELAWRPPEGTAPSGDETGGVTVRHLRSTY